MLDAAAAFLGAFAPGPIDEDAAHGLSGRAKEVCAVGKAAAAVSADQLKPRIMHQRSGLEGLSRGFGREALFGHAVKFRVDEGQQLPLGIALAALRGLQKLCYIAQRAQL